MVLLAFGLLALAGLQARVLASESESFQRAQAILLAEDMASRISANRSNAASYLTNSSTLGTGDSQPGTCDPTILSGAALDVCEWSNQLKGAAEVRGGSSVGAMVGARGCVEQVQTNPAVYRVTVAWQGTVQFNAPPVACGQNLYGSDGYRRALVNTITLANLTAP